MKKILILGISGAGKSTLARLLGAKLNLPIYFLDQLFWKPGWQTPDAEEWEAQLKSLTKLDSWIIDGNYASSYPLLMPMAELIVVLEIPRHLAIYRVIKRFFLNRIGLVKRNSSPVDCPEKIDKEFLKYIWNFPRDRQPALDQSLKLYAKQNNIRIIRNKMELSLLMNEF